MRKYEALANVLLLAGPFVTGVALAILVPVAYDASVTVAWSTLCAWALGFVLFLFGKYSLLRPGIWISFGSKQMSPWHRRAYRIGYALMFVAFIATVALAIAAHSQ